MGGVNIYTDDVQHECGVEKYPQLWIIRVDGEDRVMCDACAQSWPMQEQSSG